MENGASYLICARCAFVWLEPRARLRAEAEKKYYSLHENHGASYLNYLSKTAIPVISRVTKGSLGLDFGCGPTEGMRELLSAFEFSVESYDPFFFPKELPKNHYDFVLCSEAAEHFFEPAKEFALIHDVLKSGAWLGVSSQLWSEKGEFRDWYYRRDPTHVSFYSETSVRWIASHFGWELVELRSPFWLLKKR